jgi:hypothetical protein
MDTHDYEDTVTRFLANLPDEPAMGDEGEFDHTAPLVVFPGALVLTREQEEAMVDKAFRLIEDNSTAMGLERSMLNESDWGRTASLADQGTWFGRRKLFELMYHKRVDWRQNLTGSIFAGGHNLHLPIVRRQVQQRIARAQNYFFATEPWFSAAPQGHGDASTGPKINRYAQFKFRQAKVRAVFERAIEKAFIRGESIVKTTHERRSRFYEDILTVAVDPATKEPLIANDGDYIQESDTFEAQKDPETGEPVIDPETGEPAMVLSRDPSTLMPPGEIEYVTGPVRRERVMFNGPTAEIVYWLNFLCPEDAKSIQEAEFCAHFYDLDHAAIAQAYIDRTEATAGDEKSKKDDSGRARILRLLRDAAGARTAELDAADGVRPEDGAYRETSLRAESGAGKLAVVEFYLTADVNGDGQVEEVMMLLDRTSKKPLYYDYLDRVTEKGERPFHAVTINPVEGRWYGTSDVDLFWDIQWFIDLTMNRWNLAQSEAGRITAWNPEACYEGDVNPHLLMNNRQSYRLKPGKTMDDLVQVKYLNDIKGADLQRQIEFYMQMATTLGGVSGPNDADMAGLDTMKLATGIRNIEKGGQELFAPIISHLEPGLAEATAALLLLLCRNLDGVEVFQYFEGEVKIEEIAASEVHGLDFIVEMQLTRYKNEQELQQALAALGIVDRFYSEVPEKQTLLLPIYRNILKLFGIDHADTILQPGLYFPPPGAGVDPGAAAAAVAPSPTGKSEPNL